VLPYEVSNDTSSDAVSFEHVVGDHYQKVFHLAFRYLGDYDEACDVAQDTFLHAYRAWADFRGEADVFTWLYRITLNLCHNRRRQLHRRKRWETLSLDDPMPEDDEGHALKEIPDDTLSPERAWERQMLQDTVRRAIHRLPSHYQRVIILRDMEDLSYSDIARIERCTIQTIKSRLCRARARLRRTLSSCLEVF
jgi:RNA polymerase sigma-70 factor (ECF subfamily)